MNSTYSADSTASEGDPKLKRVCFVRGNSRGSMIGTTDVLVAYEFPKMGYETSLVVRGVGYGETVDGGVRVVGVPSIKVPIMGGAVANVYAFIRLARLRPDVVVVNAGYAVAGRLHRLLRPRTRLVLDVRSIPVSTSGGRLWIANALYGLAIRWAQPDAVSIISEGMRTQLQERFAFRFSGPVAVWGSGVDTDKFNPEAVDRQSLRESLGFSQEDIVLVYHGSFAEGRNTELLPAVVARVAEKCPRVRLILFGTGPSLPRIAQLVAELNLGGRIVLLGEQPFSRVPGLLAAADLALVPLPDHYWWRHQSPMKVYEYLAMGLPVVATPLPAHSDISDAVFLANGDSVDDLSDAVLATVRLMDERPTLRLQARRDAMRYSWADRARRLERLIHELA